MGKKMLYEIIVKDASNQYIVGRISGILETICGDRKDLTRYTNVSVDDMNFEIIRIEATERKFRKARKIIEQLYPNKCAFLN